MKTLITALFGIALLSFTTGIDKPMLDKEEAKKAYFFLNTVRANVTAYAKELQLPNDIKITTRALMWNDTLAKVAEAKALDMATRNYFAHVDPDGVGMNYYIDKAGYKLDKYQVKTKRQNSFESISAGYNTGEEVIKSLIIDTWDPVNLGHRKHLLGMEGWAGTTDIGIGFARGTVNNKFTTYVSILIAKH
ncbi:MAG: CAP domain-containing protein [Sphingobacteriales bacterium JAD_PAG50586_3]|nr:MAG: CAP domain-containing protein [Sphingobacteriales bacterium JAD_PAG50586_3]